MKDYKVKAIGKRWISEDSRGNGFFGSTKQEARSKARASDLSVAHERRNRRLAQSHARNVRFVSREGGDEGEHDWRYRTAWVHPSVRREARERALRLSKTRTRGSR